MDEQQETMNNEQGEGYSAKEKQLLQELIEARREHKAELQYENLEDYEVPPRTQFSMLKKPAVTFKLGKMEFNAASIRLFEGISNVIPSVNPTKKRLAAIPCLEEESATVEWSRQKKETWVSKCITSLDFVDKIFNLMNWDKTCRYKILGHISNSERGIILVYDLNEAIMFSPQPLEYVDKRTGETKKRRVKYYPDEYKYRIGKSYKDYCAAHQESIFENLSEYTEKTDSEQ